jgi:hypothetical protein
LPVLFASFIRQLLTAAWLVGILAGTVRILLLLSGLLTAALLLSGLLARILILLARILVLAGHQELPCYVPQGATEEPTVGCLKLSFQRDVRHAGSRNQAQN